ncbi:MbtH family protein [Micromonospora sp. NPDC048871]|uniref:MbtH family protein n=1 Tax=unclassified Micromonospora TaxID=2617518 RepID=UPI002E0D7F25|nr:MbtH family protein [Micromonospora sp. NBC_01739]
MNNPFDAVDGDFLVLVNAAGEHCLWPAFADVPQGWGAVCGPAGRTECLRYVSDNWIDPRPRRLAGSH